MNLGALDCAALDAYSCTPLANVLDMPQLQKACELLLAAGADFLVEDKSGRTPLDKARRRGDLKIIRLLEQYAAPGDSAGDQHSAEEISPPVE